MSIEEEREKDEKRAQQRRVIGELERQTEDGRERAAALKHRRGQPNIFTATAF